MSVDRFNRDVADTPLTVEQLRIMRTLGEDKGDMIHPILEIRLNRSLADMAKDLNLLESLGLLVHDPPLNLVEHLFSPMYRFMLTEKGRKVVSSK